MNSLKNTKTIRINKTLNNDERDKHRPQQRSYVVCVNLQSGHFIIIMFHLSYLSLRHAQFELLCEHKHASDYAQPKTENEKWTTTTKSATQAINASIIVSRSTPHHSSLAYHLTTDNKQRMSKYNKTKKKKKKRKKCDDVMSSIGTLYARVSCVVAVESLSEALRSQFAAQNCIFISFLRFITVQMAMCAREHKK